MCNYGGTHSKITLMPCRHPLKFNGEVQKRRYLER
nr:MAG TPA: hypothetical protein [Caudoviricetes sp.]